MTDSLAELADKQAIRDLIYTYCRAVDRLDVPLGHSIWHEDGQADYGKDFYQGPGKGVIDKIIASHDGLNSHSHQVTNILIDLDSDRAGSESYVSGTMRLEREGQQMQIGVWARYLDAWEKRDGRWGLIKRMVVYDHEEIRPVTPMGQEIRSTRDASDPSYRFLVSRKWRERILWARLEIASRSWTSFTAIAARLTASTFLSDTVFSTRTAPPTSALATRAQGAAGSTTSARNTASSCTIPTR